MRVRRVVSNLVRGTNRPLMKPLDALDVNSTKVSARKIGTGNVQGRGSGSGIPPRVVRPAD